MSLLKEKAKEFLDTAKKKGWKLAAAESCTGGLVSATLTDISGAADVLDRGFVTYSNEAKEEMLKVPAAMIAEYGAVSKEVAVAMAEGALQHSNANITVSITGIAGPTGGSDAKPVGLVFIAVASKKGSKVHQFNFDGDRDAVRHQAAYTALDLLHRSTMI